MPRERMPAVIRLSGRRVKIIVEKTSRLNYEIQGRHNGWENTITLDETLAPDQMKSIMVHEMVHDLESLVGMQMSERDVTAFSSVLFAAIADNPALFRWLAEKT